MFASRYMPCPDCGASVDQRAQEAHLFALGHDAPAVDDLGHFGLRHRGGLGALVGRRCGIASAVGPAKELVRLREVAPVGSLRASADEQFSIHLEPLRHAAGRERIEVAAARTARSANTSVRST